MLYLILFGFYNKTKNVKILLNNNLYFHIVAIRILFLMHNLNYLISILHFSTLVSNHLIHA